MLLEDPIAIQAALATMNPVARDATQLLATIIGQKPGLILDREAIQEEAFDACAYCFCRSGHSLPADLTEFERWLGDHGANVLSLAVSIVLCIARQRDAQRRWGTVGKVAALIGAAAVGAFFG